MSLKCSLDPFCHYIRWFEPQVFSGKIGVEAVKGCPSSEEPFDHPSESGPKLTIFGCRSVHHEGGYTTLWVGRLYSHLFHVFIRFVHLLQQFTRLGEPIHITVDFGMQFFTRRVINGSPAVLYLLSSRLIGFSCCLGTAGLPSVRAGHGAEAGLLLIVGQKRFVYSSSDLLPHRQRREYYLGMGFH